MSFLHFLFRSIILYYIYAFYASNSQHKIHVWFETCAVLHTFSAWQTLGFRCNSLIGLAPWSNHWNLPEVRFHVLLSPHCHTHRPSEYIIRVVNLLVIIVHFWSSVAEWFGCRTFFISVIGSINVQEQEKQRTIPSQILFSTYFHWLLISELSSPILLGLVISVSLPLSIMREYYYWKFWFFPEV